MSKYRGKYTTEFRATAVREILEKSKPIADVARELGLVEQTLRNWVAAERQRTGGVIPEAELTVTERARLKQLEKEVRELRMENEFLGKATAYVGDRCQEAVLSSRWRSPL